jgi:hypothetical protein
VQAHHTHCNKHHQTTTSHHKKLPFSSPAVHAHVTHTCQLSLCFPSYLLQRVMKSSLPNRQTACGCSACAAPACTSSSSQPGPYTCMQRPLGVCTCFTNQRFQRKHYCLQALPITKWCLDACICTCCVIQLRRSEWAAGTWGRQPQPPAPAACC